ncbi:hypothetical protein SAMN05421824_1036 [Hyunsoonleella jejuensis]|uniref:Uncharacterized protein n=1 Tax=Hyunsoonleella jejuensis TaxID=419940 RepID=A0A1H9CW46_9FLAO|nr:hypothetical protein SAMN05421824_1036 [Hyunsoonleella jejuensis]
MGNSIRILPLTIKLLTMKTQNPNKSSKVFQSILKLIDSYIYFVLVSKKNKSEINLKA